MDGIVSQARSGDGIARIVSGRGQRSSGAGGSDGGTFGPAGSGKPDGVPGFDAVVPPGGYRWWYLDALSDDGQHGLTIIGFVGSVFSPYYAWARRTRDADPENHCALNVAFYGKGSQRWSMTERGRAAIARTSEQFTIGPSAMRWERGSLVVDIDEITVPLPSRLRGEVRLTPAAICDHEVKLDPAGKHYWCPVAPIARVEVSMEKPGLSWSGSGYHDMNWGSIPLEDSFSSWVWSRAAMDEGAHIIYDTLLRDGSHSGFALQIDGDGIARPVALAQPVDLGAGFWRMPRAYQIGRCCISHRDA